MKSVEDRFWSKVDKRGPDECWEWKAGCVSNGYGRFRFNGKKQQAHRVAWQLEHGPIPKGMFVCHTCDNRLCVNINHLYLGDHKDNMDDMVAKGRQAKGEDIRQSKLTEAEVVAIRTLYATGEYTYRGLAKMFNVNATTISLIVRYKIWTHI